MSTYVEVEDAETYFAERLPSIDWDEASEDEKLRALATATRRIDQLAYWGEKTDESQENQFPRNGDTDVPTNILYACMEIAYALLEGHDTEKDLRMANMESARFGSAGIGMNPDDLPMHIVHGIPSAVAWNYLRPYLNVALTVKLERIS